MLFTFYNKYFDKDKPLRHYTQHLIVALVGFSALDFFEVSLNYQNFFLFLFATYVVDLDGFISVFLFKEKIKEAKEIVESFLAFKFTESATLGTMHHKKLNRLILHNIFGLSFLSCVLVWSIITGTEKVLVISWAIFFHFIFDISDDIYQLGHIKNWLWPVNLFLKLFGRTHAFL